MLKFYYSAVLLIFSCFISYSQVGIGTILPEPSSILDIESTTQGVLFPRMTTAERNAISGPVEGLFIYNLDSDCFQYYKGTGWSGCLSEAAVNSLDCTSTTVNGAYLTGYPLNASNTITIGVIVNIIESYTISTNTLNGYSFTATGVFTHIGLNTITLTGSGTPIAQQSDDFTITFAGRGDTCLASINVTSVLPNCLAYYNAGFSTDGVYNIDPDGPGVNPAYDCYCDMTNDGGGWTLVFNHNTAGGYWANNTEASEFNVALPGLTTDKYSILSKLDELISGTAYEFRLHYPTLVLTNHWSQTFDPRSGASGIRPVAGYNPISIDMTNNNWGGLELSGGNTFLDGSVNSGNWYYSLGSINQWSGGLPSNATPVNTVQLFVR